MRLELTMDMKEVVKMTPDTLALIYLLYAKKLLFRLFQESYMINPLT